jgi:hypothetical protein
VSDYIYLHNQHDDHHDDHHIHGGAILRMLTVILTYALTFTLLLSAAYAQKGEKQIDIEYGGLTIKIDGQHIITKDVNGETVYPFIYNGRTYLPVRAVSTALRCGVLWDEAARAVRITAAGGGAPSYGTPPTKYGFGKITVEYDDITIYIDGTRLEFGADEPFTYNGSAYVPFRAIASALGCTVDFDEASYTVLITGVKPAPSPSPAPTPTPKPTLKPSPAPALPAKVTFGADDLAIVVGDIVIKPGQNISKAIELLGKKYELESAASCAYGGKDKDGNEKMDKKYTYNNIAFSTLPIDGDLISEIDVEGAEVKASKTYAIKTTKGVKIGSTLAQAQAAHGDNYKYDKKFGELIYWLGEPNPKTPHLFFHINKNDIVDYISVYDGKSSG